MSGPDRIQDDDNQTICLLGERGEVAPPTSTVVSQMLGHPLPNRSF